MVLCCGQFRIKMGLHYHQPEVTVDKQILTGQILLYNVKLYTVISTHKFSLVLYIYIYHTVFHASAIFQVIDGVLMFLIKLNFLLKTSIHHQLLEKLH